MRRRSLLGKGNIEYVFSASSTSSSVASTSGNISISIISTANGDSIGYTYAISSSSLISSITTGATTVRIYYSANTTTSSRSGYVYLTQNGSGKIISIYVSQSGGTYTFSGQTEGYACSQKNWSYWSVNSSISGVKTGFTVTSYDGNITSVTTSTTAVTLYWAENTSTTSPKISTVNLKQDGSNKTLTMTLRQSKTMIDSEWYLPVLFYNTSTGTKTEIPYSTWSGYTSSSTYKPIAIKVSGLTNTYVSIDYMSWRTPDTGNPLYSGSYSLMQCGSMMVDGLNNNSTNYQAQYQTQCGDIRDYDGRTSPSNISDTDGKSNNQKILAADNSSSTAWQTASTISSGSSSTTLHPIVQCAWRYHTLGTNQGDWYIPARGEAAYFLMVKESWAKTVIKLNTIWSDVGTTTPSTGFDMWTSSKGPSNNPTRAYYVSVGGGSIAAEAYTSRNGALAFLKT